MSALTPLLRLLRLPATDLWHDRSYRRLWLSMATSSVGGQIAMLAVPLAAALMLHATPTQMGWLTAMEILPFILLSLPSGVWLDRVRKLPVVVVGELIAAATSASVPVAAWFDVLSMPWLYAVGFMHGAVSTVCGTASQVVLTQVVPRERLVEAHAKNALAGSTAEVLGPGLGGLLVKLLGAPLTLLVDAALLLGSALILKGVREPLAAPPPETAPPVAVPAGPLSASAQFRQQLMDGLRFVAGHRLLVALASLMCVWQMAHNAATTAQILLATRTLGLSEQAIGLCYMGLGLGSIVGSMLGNRLSKRLGPGPCLVLGYAITGTGWLLAAAAPAGPWGVAAFAWMLVSFSAGAVFIFINFLALRQAVTPEPLLGRMTSTMRWLTLLAAAPGALLGGWLGEHVGLRATMGFAGSVSLLLALVAWQMPIIRGLKKLPRPESDASPA